MRTRQLKQLDEAVCISTGTPIFEAAQLMSRKGIGCLVVTDDESRPVGIVTDRDLTLRAVAWPQDPKATPVSEVMTAPVECVDEKGGMAEVMKRMTALGVRRIPITRAGCAIGLVSFDDIVQELSFNINSLSIGAAEGLADSRRQAKREEFVEDAEHMLQALRMRLRSANWHAKQHFLDELDDVREHVSKALKGKAL